MAKSRSPDFSVREDRRLRERDGRGAATSPIRTFTPGSASLLGRSHLRRQRHALFSENSGLKTVLSGTVSSGAISDLAPEQLRPRRRRDRLQGRRRLRRLRDNPGTGDLFKLNGPVTSPTAVISNIGIGYLGGIAFDAAGNVLLTDTNDPTFAGLAGKLVATDSTFPPLPPSISPPATARRVRRRARFRRRHLRHHRLDDHADPLRQHDRPAVRQVHGFGSIRRSSPTWTTSAAVFHRTMAPASSGSTRASPTTARSSASPRPEPVRDCSSSLQRSRRVRVGGREMTRRPPRKPGTRSLGVLIVSRHSATVPSRADQFFATQVITRHHYPATKQNGFTNPDLALGALAAAGNRHQLHRRLQPRQRRLYHARLRRRELDKPPLHHRRARAGFHRLRKTRSTRTTIRTARSPS